MKVSSNDVIAIAMTSLIGGVSAAIWGVIHVILDKKLTVSLAGSPPNIPIHDSYLMMLLHKLELEVYEDRPVLFIRLVDACDGFIATRFRDLEKCNTVEVRTAWCQRCKMELGFAKNVLRQVIADQPTAQKAATCQELDRNIKEHLDSQFTAFMVMIQSPMP